MASFGRITPGIVHHVTCHTLMGRYTLAHLIFLLACDVDCVATLNVLLLWLFVIFALQGGIWSALLHHS
jgi:hypothetical protein